MDMRRIILFITVSVIFIACGVTKISKTINTYEESEKNREEKSPQSVPVPIITAVSNTGLNQKKGTTEISIEPSKFHAKEVVNLDINDGKALYLDNEKPGYEIWESVKTYEYEPVSDNPKRAMFVMSITNRSEMPLLLKNYGFILKMGNETWTKTDGFKKAWTDDMILTGETKEIPIDGITKDNIKDGTVYTFFLNGFPTKFNKAGDVTERQNFTWVFKCNIKNEDKERRKVYTYEPRLIPSKQCEKCTGKGHLSELVTCPNCKGSGTSLLLKSVACSKCDGKGKVYATCDNCSGKGILYFPQSGGKHRGVKSSVTLNGWKIKVVTKPAGANIKLIDPQTGEYNVLKGTTPGSIEWLCKSGGTCPIIIESMGKKVKVLPFDAKGKESGAINVDFTKDVPVVKGGKVVE